MMPAVGWAKDLGLDKRDVYDYLRKLLPDKRNFDDDFEKAWKYADCRFEWKANESKRKEQENLLVELLRACQKPTSRQELIAKVFHGQVWLFEEAMEKALKSGLAQVEKVKLKQGKGRKSHVYTLTEKGQAFLESLRTNPRESLAMVVGLESMEGQGYEKNLYITPLEQYNGQVGLVGETENEGIYKLEQSQISEDFNRRENLNNTAREQAGGGGRAGAGSGAGPGQFAEAGNGKVIRLEHQDEEHLRARAFRLIARLENAWLGTIGNLPNRKGYYKLVFGALRREGAGITYELGGWGRYAFALGEILEELGHQVIYPHLQPLAGPPEPQEEGQVDDLDWLEF
jgi:predicted transcriptional regulator